MWSFIEISRGFYTNLKSSLGAFFCIKIWWLGFNSYLYSMKRNELFNVGTFNGTLALIFWVGLGVTKDLSFMWCAVGLSILMIVAFGLTIVAKK
tara:strand:+ start:80 stop:361 length:282 start_codon:yes stop_codon:yes gene_type:complete